MNCINRRIVSLLMAALLAFGLTPLSAFAAEPVDTPTFDSDTAEEQGGDPALTEPETIYTLHLTHIFRFQLSGKNVSVQASEDISLTGADFEDGVCNLSRFAYDVEQLTVTKADAVRLEDFDGNGVHRYGAQIVYAVSSGWQVVRRADAEGKETLLREVFCGKLEDYAFVPANVVRIKLSYKYSNTGGLAGIDAAAPETVEMTPEEQADGTYKVTWALPTVEGFRIVLDPSELNKYVKNPPNGTETPAELETALERGDFDVDIDHHTIYYYQEQSGQETHPSYQNRYSTEYNQAWNAARWLEVTGEAGYYAQAVSGNDALPIVSGPGANPLVNPQLEVTLTEAQLASAMAGDGLGITVYYRRNAAWYTVNHWVPKTLSGLTDFTGWETKTEGGVEYVRLDQEPLQGRVGALTRAAAKTDGLYEELEAIGFSQKLIENSDITNAATVVDIYYKAADSYRVIFDTDYTYIPRQQVALGSPVNFTGITEPKRIGYTFAGWRYLKKNAAPNPDGSYADDQYSELDKTNPALTVDTTLIAKAKLQDTGGVLALHLYPKWEPATTQVRVILWTEDLTGTDDVQAIATGGNSTVEGSYYAQKYAGYQGEPVTHAPQLGTADPHYSNVGSFTITLDTDSSLLNSGALLDTIQSQVTEKFKEVMGQENGVDVDQFYAQKNFEILHEESNGANSAAATASGDGKTMIYVYFTRNIYTLKFHYYGSMWDTQTPPTWGSDYYVATNTNGYSIGGAEACVKDGELDFSYNQNGNQKKAATVTSHDQMPVPQAITIKAKYGADLRDVWPASRTEEHVMAESQDTAFISWAVTDGKYRDDVRAGSASHSYTILGTYASMSSEIVAEPGNPDVTHHLVAYWNSSTLSYYRYTHCYEAPGLDVNDAGIQRASIYNDDVPDPRNILYLVPIDNEAIARYEFTDLMRVSYQNGAITYNDPNGAYYAVRQYTAGGTTRYYAVARQVTVVSTNSIQRQSPSTRLHMTRVNGNPDHSTRYGDGAGLSDNRVGTAGAPYDLYFYYDRDRYTITYMVPSDNITTAAEVTLGTVTLPYGALVTQEKYGFALDYTDTNQTKTGSGAYKYPWTVSGSAVSVCPDRSERGTAVWKFKGWGLGPAGLNMQWTMPEESEAQGQADDAFAIAANLRLYAIWETPTYTVTFHLNGGTAGKEQVEARIPANTRYSASGSIPRPLREGYTLAGWYLADENGIVTEPQTAFDFDQTITENKHVAAVWTAVSTERFDYTVYDVAKTLRDADKGKYNATVQISNGQIVTAGGETYFVLEKDSQKDQVFLAGSVLNLTAKMHTGYVPQQTNQTLTMGAANDTYNVIFCYEPVIPGQHTVNFVLAGTEQGTPETVKTFTVNADQTVVTPQSAAVKELVSQGYALVNPNGSGYERVTDGERLKWIDADGTAKDMATLKGDAIPQTVTYLVEPIEYKIAYQNAPGSPAAADTALTAANNPAAYTVKDTFTAVNPALVYDNGKWYQFSHWSLGSGTTVTDHGNAFPTLTVDAGTIGNLIFIANWTEMTDTGGLTVSKTVAGSAGETDRDFHFTVTLNNTAVSGIFGDMTFTNSVASFTLKHGENKTASSLPAGITYTVTELEANQNGYTTTAAGDTGTITNGVTVAAAFTNTKASSGGSGESGGGSSSGGSGSSGSGGGSSGGNPACVPEWLNGKDHLAYVAGYTDGTVRPLNNISRAETAVIFFRLLNEDIRAENLTDSNSFADVNKDMWCNTAISTMAKLGIVKGRGPDHFDPNAPITRAEFAVICARFDSSQPHGSESFTDISGCWAEAEIRRAAALGWIKGYTDGTFRPANHITRAEAITLINRMLGRLPEDEADLLDGMKVWPDNRPGAWYYLAVQEATNSHEFSRKDGLYEQWTKLITTPD